MRRFFSLVALVGLASLPTRASAQDADYPPGEPPPPAIGVEAEIEAEPPPPPEAYSPEPYVEPPPPGMPPELEVEGEGRPESPPFLVEIQPYGFLPLRIGGTTSSGGVGAPVNVRLKDLFEGDQLSIGGGLRLEAWASRLGLIVDGAFLQLERDALATAAGTEWRSRQFIGDFLGGFRLIQSGPLAGDTAFGLAITGGVRMIYDRERIFAGGNAVEIDDWIAKGSVGADIPIRFSPGFGLRARGAVRYPDFDWSVTGLAEIDSLPVGLDVGYRYENLDYEEGGIDTEVDVHSVYLGLGFKGLGRNR